VDIAKRNPLNFLCGSGRFARIEKRGVGEEFVGFYLYLVHLYRCLESNDYGRLLSGNNAYIKVKRLVCRLPIVSVNFEAKRNFCAAQGPPAMADRSRETAKARPRFEKHEPGAPSHLRSGSIVAGYS
jgi:hypothetical protein